MKKILVFALALMLAIPALAFADGNDADITAQGTVVVTAAPDMVTVTANASVSGRSVADAQEGMNAIVQSATQKLLDLGVEEKDIVTTSYTYYPTYDYNSETPTVNGYQANHTLSITCKDVDMLDSVIGVVTDCGMSEIYNVEYDVSNRSELYRQALKAAIEEAAAKAEGMAEAAGMSKPSGSQIYYIDLSEGDSAVVYQQEETNVLSRLLTSLNHGIYAVVEYFD